MASTGWQRTPKTRSRPTARGSEEAPTLDSTSTQNSKRRDSPTSSSKVWHLSPKDRGCPLGAQRAAGWKGRGLSGYAPSSCLIHRIAWKGYSRNFTFIGFSEVQHLSRGRCAYRALVNSSTVRPASLMRVLSVPRFSSLWRGTVKGWRPSHFIRTWEPLWRTVL